MQPLLLQSPTHASSPPLPPQAKTRLLVTNQLQYCPHADQIIVVDEGRVVVQGDYETCMAHPIFAGLVREHAAEARADEEAPMAVLSSMLLSVELSMRAVSRGEAAKQEVLEELDWEPEFSFEELPQAPSARLAVTASPLVRPSRVSTTSGIEQHDVKVSIGVQAGAGVREQGCQPLPSR